MPSKHIAYDPKSGTSKNVWIGAGRLSCYLLLEIYAFLINKLSYWPDKHKKALEENMFPPPERLYRLTKAIIQHSATRTPDRITAVCLQINSS
ncbi:hypothetical protein D0469_04365 [Peribacillus saganii]|uniref:Uncharacterized protein n=1 Tax=Peribacillus saganii TaxID=2303992 RepID=A0A372LSL9_9BACI|nr:hypothetical protein D0469_04365 [Peribacillus saganii]